MMSQHSISTKKKSHMNLHHLSISTRVALWASLVIMPFGCSADSVTYGNLGSESSYNTAEGDPIGNAFDGNDYAQGSSFVFPAYASFTSLRVALSCFASCTDPFVVTLSRDAGDQPGVTLEAFTVPAGALGPLGVNNSPLVLNSVLHSNLAAGTQYWITVMADLDDSIAWNLNSTGDSSAEAISTNGGLSWFSPSGNTPGAFDVTGSIPEPGSAGLVLGAGLMLGIALKRRSASNQ